MGLSLRRNRTDKTAIVFARMMFMLQYKTASHILGNATNSRRRIQGIEHIPQLFFIPQTETDIRTKMIEICRHRSIRTFQSIILRKDLDAVFDIIRNILLLFPVLLRPFHALYRIISNGSGRLRLLRTCQRHRLILISLPLEQDFRSRHQPHTRLGSINQGNEKTRIHTAGFQEKRLKRCNILSINTIYLFYSDFITHQRNFSCQNNLTECLFG